MMFLTTLFALVAVASGAVISPKIGYTISEDLAKILAENDDCISPANFEVTDFTLWQPDQGTNSTRTALVQFTFNDKDTSISTSCQYNSSSVNQAQPWLAPRWPCDNRIIQFIWDADDAQLTMIEKVCPDSQGSASMEASGSLWPQFNCTTTDHTSPIGEGTFCTSADASYDVTFSSLQPVLTGGGGFEGDTASI